MVANETGLTDLTLETVWSVYDTLFCEVSPPGCLWDCSPHPCQAEVSGQQCMVSVKQSMGAAIRLGAQRAAACETRELLPWGRGPQSGNCFAGRQQFLLLSPKLVVSDPIC